MYSDSCVLGEVSGKRVGEITRGLILNPWAVSYKQLSFLSDLSQQKK